VGTAGVLLLLVLSAAIATGVVAYIIINRCKRQQAQISAGNLQWEAQEAPPKVEQEPQPPGPEGAPPKVEQEPQPPGPEEAPPKVEQEPQPAEPEEAPPKVEQEPQRLEAEEAQRQAEKEHKRPVEDRGGRPHIPTTESKEQVTRESKLRQPKPEIVCWQREWRWILAVEVPEDVWEEPGLVVHQNASPLAPDEREGHWRLDQVCGQVTVHWNEDEAPQDAKITLGEENYLLFKLSSQDQQGRRVKSPSFGSYLVVVPESWERDEKLSGLAPASPEPVSVEGYQGHFFDLEKGSDKRIAFRTSEGKSTSIESKAARFELDGTELCDASEGIGHLFGKSPPRIRALHDRPWTDIGTIVVGEEGSGRGRWRKAFSPAPEGREQDLPAEAALRKDGWYFLRFYDTNDDLAESLDFRFVSALREIKILQPSPFPSEGDHESVYVEFRHESGFVIQPADDLARSIQVESKNNKTTLTVPPEPIYDETRWLVGSEGKLQVQVAVLVERLWWAVGQEGNPPSAWEDKLLTLACDDFVATSKKALWLRLPRKRWTDRVSVGFEQSRARPCAVKVTEREISVSLRDFGDCQEVRERDRDQFLNIWIEGDGEPVSGRVAIIPASKGPIICFGHGKKKTAIATAVLRDGIGVIKVNGRPVEHYFEKAPLRAKQFLWRLLELSDVSKILAQMEVSIEVTGSNPGTVQQVKASAHALARALMKYDSQLKPLLKQQGFGGAKVTERSGLQGERQSNESNRIGARD
jgi:ribosomal protein S9